jgi:hypothetical protein
LSLNHVVIAIVGKPAAEAVAGLAGLAVADIVGEDEVILRCIQQLPFAE